MYQSTAESNNDKFGVYQGDEEDANLDDLQQNPAFSQTYLRAIRISAGLAFAAGIICLGLFFFQNGIYGTSDSRRLKFDFLQECRDVEGDSSGGSKEWVPICVYYAQLSTMPAALVLLFCALVFASGGIFCNYSFKCECVRLFKRDLPGKVKLTVITRKLLTVAIVLLGCSIIALIAGLAMLHFYLAQRGLILTLRSPFYVHLLVMTLPIAALVSARFAWKYLPSSQYLTLNTESVEQGYG